MTELHDILPKELKVTLESLDYQEDGGLLITGIKFLENNLRVDFTLSFGGIDRPNEFWQIAIEGLKKEKIVFNGASYLEFYSDHCLLFEFTDNYIELYYNGKVDNSAELFIDLYQLHQARYHKFLDFGIGINAPDGILDLCKRENGLFARGSKQILEQYAKCLANHGTKTNFIGEINKENTNVKLLLFGDSYFVAESFKFRCLSQKDMGEGVL